MLQTRAATKRLFDLAEELAAREITADPKAFVNREIV
jgi:hypothetical protein